MLLPDRWMLALVFVLTTAIAFAQPSPKRIYQTARLNGDPITLDGHLNDAAWQTVEWTGEFIQREPEDRAAPSRQTEFKVLYDDESLYFAFRIHDDPSQITSHLARHDWFPGDWVEVNIDSRADNRTAYSFTLSLSGTRGDEYISEDGSRWDGNWDPVWEGATQVDEHGWTAEMRIPLSQIRFDPDEPRPWGLQVQRRIFREGERSTWQEIPRDVNGWVSNFGDLCGIRDLAPKGRAELLPYFSAQHERYPAEDGNPYRTGQDNKLGAGLDAKFGLGSDFSLDLTVNPDFGQVEADPSQVNLTAFETFFQEKRPFFIEGQDILDLRLAPAITGGHFTRDRLFYSRRIGRQPQYRPDLDEGEYSKSPDWTSIIGAAKLSGKTSGGLSVGILESVTSREQAQITDSAGNERHETVEPLSNYFVGRVTQDYREGDTVVGAMVTSTARKIEDDHLEFLSRKAWSGAVDLQHYIKGRDYRLNVRLSGSHLKGSEESILRAQTASARYYQRPDNTRASVDTTRTTLSGHAGSAMFTRTGNNSRFKGQLGAAWRSSGYEINDLGYMRLADEVNQFLWLSYHRRNPFGIFNQLQINGNEWLDWDTGGHLLRKAFNVNCSGQFRNQSRFYASVSRSFEEVSNTALRGGPSSRWPGKWSLSANYNSDDRKKLVADLGLWQQIGDNNSVDQLELWCSLTYKPTNSLRFSLSPSVVWNDNETQYVTTADSDLGDRYVHGRIDQTTTALTFRMDWCLTPNLTIQYYGSPFVSAGSYNQYKHITDPQAGAYDDRFHVYDDDQITATDDGYDVDENGNGQTDYSFGNPDFNVSEFNSNLVVRWQYRLGSTIYLVWSQNRSNYLNNGSFDLGQDLDNLFSGQPDDVLLVKVNMWLSL